MSNNFIFLRFGTTCFYVGPASFVGIDVTAKEFVEAPVKEIEEENNYEV